MSSLSPKSSLVANYQCNVFPNYFYEVMFVLSPCDIVIYLKNSKANLTKSNNENSQCNKLYITECLVYDQLPIPFMNPILVQKNAN